MVNYITKMEISRCQKRRGILKRLYCSFVLLFLCFVNTGYSYTVDEIFENFRTAYEKSKNFSAEFEETTLYKTRKSVSRGRFTFGMPNLLHMEYVALKNPDKVIKKIVLDGAYVWSYVPLLNEVNKQKLNNSQRREILPGTGASLEDLSKNWNMKLVPDEAANAKGVHQLQLTPKPELLNRNVGQRQETADIQQKQETQDIKEMLELWIKEGEWLPVQFGYVTVYEDGNRRSVVMKLSNIKRDKKLPPNIFKMVFPKDAEVIDLTDN